MCDLSGEWPKQLDPPQVLLVEQRSQQCMRRGKVSSNAGMKLIFLCRTTQVILSAESERGTMKLKEHLMDGAKTFQPS